MGPGLADGVVQGLAEGDAFRSTPLWGLGQRLFFLHDVRTSDLQVAIREHPGSRRGTFNAQRSVGASGEVNQDIPWPDHD